MEKEFQINLKTRIWFPVAAFAELADAPRDERGLVGFAGTVGYVVSGYQLNFVVNGVAFNDADLTIILDGGISGDIVWKQGPSEEMAVSGFLETIEDHYVLHPEKIG